MAEPDPADITIADVVAALEDIAEANPDLMEYILTCYPPELMIHMSDETKCRLSEVLEESLPQQERIDS